jgi:hypothetical protein
LQDIGSQMRGDVVDGGITVEVGLLAHDGHTVANAQGFGDFAESKGRI